MEKEHLVQSRSHHDMFTSQSCSHHDMFTSQSCSHHDMFTPQSCSHHDNFDKPYSYNTSRGKLVREAIADYLYGK